MLPALLLINTGSPLQADAWYIHSFLKNFLADRHVFRLNPLLHLLLKSVVPARRAKALQPAYAAIFAGGQSPQSRAMRSLCREVHPRFTLQHAFLYAPPQVKGTLYALKERGVDRIIALPLYPQPSGTTTAAARSALNAALKELHYQPKLTFIEGYWQEELYLEGIAGQLRRQAAAGELDLKRDTVYFSFHSLPCSYLKDPREQAYLQACRKSTELIAGRAGLASFECVFQSKFGPAAWQGPFLKDRLLAHDFKSGRAAVICPGFAMDCLETLYEVGIELRAKLKAERQAELKLLPCLNDSAAQRRLIESLTLKALRETSDA